MRTLELSLRESIHVVHRKIRGRDSMTTHVERNKFHSAYILLLLGKFLFVVSIQEIIVYILLVHLLYSTPSPSPTLIVFAK